MKKAEIILGTIKIFAEHKISDKEGYERVAEMDYNGKSKQAKMRVVASLARELEGMGYEPWFDRKYWEGSGAYE
jgi:hypothetical protein